MSARTILNPPLNQLNAILSSEAQTETPTNLFATNVNATNYVAGASLNCPLILDSTGSTGTVGQVLTIAANGRIVWATPA